MFAQALYFASFKHFGSKSQEYLVSEYTKKAKTVCFIGIQECFGFDQCFLDFVEGFVNTWFHFPWHSSVCKSSWDFVAPHLKEAKHFVSLKSNIFLAPSSDFWSLVRVSWILDSTGLDAVLYKMCSDFVSPHIKKAKTICFIGIQDLFSSEQCFLDFGECFRQHFISLVSTRFCL